MSKDYDSGNMIKKSPLEHVRTYPAMYIGSKGTAGVMHTLREVVANSVDECMAGNGNLIEVTLLTPTRISVRDRGRGIPTSLNKKYNETGIELAVALNTGGKFPDGDKGYNSSCGMHGVGLGATNAVSNFLSVEVRLDGKIQRATFSKGVKIKPKEQGKLEFIGNCDKKDTGTTITWELDPTVMTETVFDAAYILTYLKSSAFLSSGVTFAFIDKRDPKNEKRQEFLSENGLTDFIESLRDGRETLIDKPISFSGTMTDGDMYEITFTYLKDYKNEVYLYVNRNLTPNGGTAIVGFRTGLTKAVNDISKLLGILREKDKPFKTSDTDEGLVAVVNLTMKYPELDGQTKSKLNNESVRSDIYAESSKKLNLYFESNPTILAEIGSKCLLGRRAREASQRARDLVMDKNTDKLSGPSKLKDCISTKSKDCEVYLVEGDSAAGNLLNIRDVHTQAYMALKGKVINVEKSGRELALANNEIRSMIQAFGCGYGDNFDISKLKYDKIIILTDADADGSHIRALLLTFLYRYCPGLVTEGKVYVCVPPLYRITWGRDKMKFYKDDEDYSRERDKFIEEGKIAGKDFVASRFKGLGEMQKEDLRDSCIDKGKRTLLRVSVEDTLYADEVIRKLMSSEEISSRKSFFQTHGEEL